MEKVNKDGLTEEEFLAAYNPGNYERPSVTVDMMLLRLKKDMSCLQILLIQRKNHPCIDEWALPGGFINIDESAYQAACRELEEETGLKDVYLEQLYTMSQPDRDPRMRVIDIAYTGLLPFHYDGQEKAGDDAKDASWFDLVFTDEQMQFTNEQNGVVITYKLEKKTFKNGVLRIQNFIPVQESEDALAFDHEQIILEGLMRLRNKVMYCDVAFNLMPEEFTLPDLQNVYEMILGKDLYKANFRDKISDKVMKSGRKAKPVTGKRIADLYRYSIENDKY